VDVTSFRTPLIALLVFVFMFGGLGQASTAALAQAPPDAPAAESPVKKKKKKKKRKRKRKRKKKRKKKQAPKSAAETGDLAAAKVQFEAGLRKEKVGDTAGAIQRFEEAIRIYPGFPLALNELGVLLASQGNLVGAEQRLASAVAMDPDFGAAWGNLGEVRRQAARHGAALEAYGHALRMNRGDAQAWYGLTASLLATGRKGEALAASKGFLALANTDHPHYGNVTEAAKRLAAAGVREKTPTLPTRAPVAVAATAVAATATTATALGDEALPQAKRGPYSHHEGDAAYQAARYMKALEAYRKQAKTRVDDSELLYKIGATYAVIGDYQSASRWWARGLAVAPDRAILLRHATLAQLTAAAPAAEAGTEVTGPSPLERARQALMSGMPAAALITLQGEQTDEAVYLRAESLLGLGRYDESISAFKEAVRLLPKDRGPLGGLAEALLRTGKKSAAAPHLSSWLEGATTADETFLLRRAQEAKSRISYGPPSDEDEEDL
jgi:tetratricopeptide (TPR) repeat protein